MSVTNQFINFKVTCDAGYVGYTRGHLHECVDGHKQKSSICKPYFREHNLNVPPCLLQQFHMLTKCSNKFDCLINKMPFKYANGLDSCKGIHFKNL